MRRILFLVLIMIIVGCSGAATTVNIRRDLYEPKIDGALHEQYRGKSLFLYDIIDATNNTTNFHYYSPDKKVGYAFYYDGDTWQQPLASFYWYAYRKAFQSIDVYVEEHRAALGLPELRITLLSLDSQELKYSILLIKKGNPVGKTFEKKFTVTMPKSSNEDKSVLEKTAYDMIDKTVSTVLADLEFQKAFLE